MHFVSSPSRLATAKKGYAAVTCVNSQTGQVSLRTPPQPGRLSARIVCLPFLSKNLITNPQGKVLLLDFATKVKRQGLLCPNPSNS